MRDNRPAGASHIPTLVQVLSISQGPILELGTGPFSTALLHSLAVDQNRELVSYENDLKYYIHYKNFARGLHAIHFVTDWDSIVVQRTWGMAFVDHAPEERRAIEVSRLANYADYIVVHDSEKLELPSFKYRTDSVKQRPNTTILSNKYEL